MRRRRAGLGIALALLLTVRGASHGEPRRPTTEGLPQKATRQEAGTIAERPTEVKGGRQDEPRKSAPSSIPSIKAADRGPDLPSRGAAGRTRPLPESLVSREEGSGSELRILVSRSKQAGTAAEEGEGSLHSWDNRIRYLGDHSSYRRIGAFVVTAYTAGPESCDKDPSDPLYGVTATGAKVRANHTIAADWDVLPPGSVVVIEGLGAYVVEDRGGGVVGKHIDIYMPDLDAALAFGRQQRQVWVKE